MTPMKVVVAPAVVPEVTWAVAPRDDGVFELTAMVGSVVVSIEVARADLRDLQGLLESILRNNPVTAS